MTKSLGNGFSRLQTVVCTGAVCLLMLLFVQAAAAQEGHGLALEITASALGTRTDAPLPLEARFDWQGYGVLEGRLQLVLRDGQEASGNFVTVGYFETDDIVLTGGRQVVPFLLPPVPVRTFFEQLEIDAQFATADGTLKLTSQVLTVPGDERRAFVTCVCEPSVRGPLVPHVRQLVDSLRFESFYAPFRADNDKRRKVVSYMADVRSADMPESPLLFLGYDQVVLPIDSLPELRPKQLAALDDWVSAGGSLCVLMGGVHSPPHVEFLNGLLSLDHGDGNVSLDPQGQLQWQADPVPSLLLARRGLGRAVIVTRPDTIATAPSLGEWRRAQWFLWRLRAEHRPLMVETGQITAVTFPEHFTAGNLSVMDNNLNVRHRLAVQPLPFASTFIEELMPTSVRLVPPWILGLILLGYVALVGPVDYYVLGLFRQRKLTWIVFPLVTIGVTAFTVWLSNTAMATGGTGRTLTFVDVDSLGRAVREHRFQILFTGQRQAVTTQFERSTFAPLDYRSFGATTLEQRRRLEMGRDDQSLVPPPSYRGRPPWRFEVTQEVPQWTPQLNRELSIAPARAGTAFDWTVPIDVSNGLARRRLAKRVEAAFGKDAHSLVLAGTQLHEITRGTVPWRYRTSGQTATGLDIRQFLQQSSAPPPQGLFSLAARVAPHGGRNLEDLALLDPTAQGDMLLLIAIGEEQEGIRVYRRLYQKELNSATTAPPADPQPTPSIDPQPAPPIDGQSSTEGARARTETRAGNVSRLAQACESALVSWRARGVSAGVPEGCHTARVGRTQGSRVVVEEPPGSRPGLANAGRPALTRALNPLAQARALELRGVA